MFKFILKFLSVFAVFVLVGAIQKPVFLAVNGGGNLPFMDWLRVIWHGLPMDCTVAGYLTVVPGVILTIRLWLKDNELLPKILTGYYFVIAVLVSLTAVTNIMLYAHWGFPLDTTPLFYLTSSPSATAASATPGETIAALAAFLIYSDIIFMSQSLIDKKLIVGRPPHRGYVTAVGVLMTGLLFIPIRGGVTVSTMNPGRAYFSPTPLLNHAAVNPAFSLLYSAAHQTDFGKQFRYLDPQEAAAIVDEMYAPASLPRDTIFTGRPDIYLVIAESFSSHLLPTQGGGSVALRLDSMTRQGVLFDNFYASSFRTDRALPAILGAIPGQPNTSLMKYINKTEGLPSLPGLLKDNGYLLAYYYGGDINFTNMKSYLVNCGFAKIISDTDFPIAERTGKWGAHDHLVFRRALADAKADTAAGPHFKVIQTSSSHEPFEVPFTSAHSAPAANAFAYADSCIADFADSIAALPRRSLVIIVPDHYGCYPALGNDEQPRHHVPLIFWGNALSLNGVRISRYGSQTDLAATLAGQLGLDGSAFAFSRDMLADIPAPFAFYSSPNAFAISDSTGTASIDIATGQVAGNPDMAMKAKAYIQQLYNYLDSL